MKWLLGIWPCLVGAGLCVLFVKWSVNWLLYLVMHFDDSPTESHLRRRAPRVWVVSRESFSKEWNSEPDIHTAGFKDRR